MNDRITYTKKERNERYEKEIALKRLKNLTELWNEFEDNALFKVKYYYVQKFVLIVKEIYQQFSAIIDHEECPDVFQIEIAWRL